MTPLKCEAPGKLNLCLYLGPTRADGLHEIASLFESVSLADTLVARPCEGLHDRVICERIEGENLAEHALRGAREVGLLNGPPLEVTIEKRVPIAAGMGGGSSDAAAALRIAAAIEDQPLDRYRSLAFNIGADVPSQLAPGTAFVHGAGERVQTIAPEQLAGAQNRAYVIVEQSEGLSTAEVFRQADRTNLPEPTIVQREEALLERIAGGIDFDTLCAMIENAFEPAIVALRPELARIPQELIEHGARAAAFTGSGPTAFGVFETPEAAEAAKTKLRAAGHIAHAALPVDPAFAAPKELA
jgi:4-diphosphocytidyl-2-C-methyl-D-erythritol kinase